MSHPILEATADLDGGHVPGDDTTGDTAGDRITAAHARRLACTATITTAPTTRPTPPSVSPTATSASTDADRPRASSRDVGATRSAAEPPGRAPTSATPGG